jgi:hypothetical protein
MSHEHVAAEYAVMRDAKPARAGPEIFGVRGETRILGPLIANKKILINMFIFKIITNKHLKCTNSNIIIKAVCKSSHHIG